MEEAVTLSIALKNEKRKETDKGGNKKAALLWDRSRKPSVAEGRSCESDTLPALF